MDKDTNFFFISFQPSHYWKEGCNCHSMKRLSSKVFEADLREPHQIASQDVIFELSTKEIYS
ncbi:asr3612 [Nostoc sp. PCC 7120 = FACHB-418]|nr:asr3612 [Nostoc sp. PCC 7120 = FACHB-418]